MKYRYRAAIFFGLIALAIFGRFFSEVAPYPAAASPFVAVASFIGTWNLDLFALGFALIAALRRRVLCRTVCPLGFCFENIGIVRKKTTGSNTLPRLFRNFPRIGGAIALLTLLGVGFHVVGFLWLDPFVIFGSVFQGIPSFLVYVSIILLVLAWFAPTFWCGNVCPLGGTQDILYTPRRFVEHLSKREPESVTETPAFATPPLMERRRFTQWTVFSVLGISGIVAMRRRQTVAAELPIRPPGSVREPLFSALCTRCGACIRACPTKLLQPLDGRADWTEYATPTCSFRGKWCRDDCVECTQVCPSNAIRPVLRDEKKNVKIGLAVVNFEHCLLADDRECAICARDCPTEAIFFEWSEKEYRQIIMIDETRCNGCGRCLVSCPMGDGFDPAAIKPLRIVKNETR